MSVKKVEDLQTFYIFLKFTGDYKALRYLFHSVIENISKKWCCTHKRCHHLAPCAQQREGKKK